MSFDPKELLNKVGGNDLVKGISDKVGASAEQVQNVAHELLAKAQESGSGLVDNAEEIAAKLGVPVEKVQEIAGSLTSNIQEQAGKLGETVSGAFNNILKGFDKDGDGNPLNDITDTAAGVANAATDAVKDVADKAKGLLGGLFGKKE